MMGSERAKAAEAESTTQWVARVLGLTLPEPPAKVGRAKAARCWLCGGATHGMGWPQHAAIAPTFTQHNTAAVSDSDAVCRSCVALTRAETFQAMVRARGLGLKTWTQCGWHSYSHLVLEDGRYDAPVPSRMRDVLLTPPAGRWLLAINTTGKKHTIFRGRVASAADFFPVQVDEESLWIAGGDFAACLAGFERLTALGCGKDGIETGRYHPADTMRAGLRRWREAEEAFAPWRERQPGLVGLVRIVARSAKAMEELGLAEAPESPPNRLTTPQPQPAQGSLL